VATVRGKVEIYPNKDEVVRGKVDVHRHAPELLDDAKKADSLFLS
jgi:hypothetical protein